MKKLLLLSAFLTMGFNGFAQTKDQVRAKEGDKVWLIINQVKDESKPDYLTWMTTHFMPILVNATDETLKKQYQSTRWLEPVRQNLDKSWTYAFVMDPVVPQTNYNITAMLTLKYGAEKATELNKLYESYFVVPTVVHILKQTQH